MADLFHSSAAEVKASTSYPAVRRPRQVILGQQKTYQSRRTERAKAISILISPMMSSIGMGRQIVEVTLSESVAGTVLLLPQIMWQVPALPMCMQQKEDVSTEWALHFNRQISNSFTFFHVFFFATWGIAHFAAYFGGKHRFLRLSAFTKKRDVARTICFRLSSLKVSLKKLHLFICCIVERTAFASFCRVRAKSCIPNTTCAVASVRMVRCNSLRPQRFRDGAHFTSAVAFRFIPKRFSSNCSLDPSGACCTTSKTSATERTSVVLTATISSNHQSPLVEMEGHQSLTPWEDTPKPALVDRGHTNLAAPKCSSMPMLEALAPCSSLNCGKMTWRLWHVSEPSPEKSWRVMESV